MKIKIINTIAFLVLLVTLASAQSKQRYNVRMGDKYYNVFNYTNAIVLYKKALQEKKVDSVYVLQKLADSYRLINNPKEAEYWYGVLVTKSEDPKNFLYFAEKRLWITWFPFGVGQQPKAICFYRCQLSNGKAQCT